MAHKSARKTLVVSWLASISLLLAGCGTGGAVQLVSTLTPTPTPLSTPLPTVATQVPFGAEDRPYQMVVVPPGETTQTGTALSDALDAQTGRAFKVVITQSGPEALAALCGETPTFAWVSGLTLIAAQLQNCGQAALLVRQGRGDAASTGVRSELIVSSEAQVTSVAGFRERDFCRLSAQDTVTWLLPVLVMRSAGGFDPFVDFRNIRDLPDLPSIVREVALNRCVGAIPSGTLGDYSVPGFSNVVQAIDVVPGTITPELPYAGLVISPRVPQAVAEQVSRMILRNADALEGLIPDGTLVEAGDLSDIVRLMQNAGIATLNQ